MAGSVERRRSVTKERRWKAEWKVERVQKGPARPTDAELLNPTGKELGILEHLVAVIL